MEFLEQLNALSAKTRQQGALLSVILCVMISSPAIASTTSDGSYLLKNCTTAMNVFDGHKSATPEESFSMGTCLGVIDGTRSTMVALENFMDASYRTCFPKAGISNEQAARIVVKYLKKHPADLDNDKAVLTILAFKDAYPCQ